MKKILFTLYILFLCISIFGQSYTKKYDEYFQKYSKQYFMGVYDWRWFKAQGIAESNLNPYAKSQVGAEGIMQIMPTTGKEIKLQNAFNPQMNIDKGIFYNKRLWKVWKSPIMYFEKIYFTFASYNAGLGHIIKAQTKAGTLKKDTKIWKDNVEEGLPYITGEHSKETRNYVKRIKKFYLLLKAGAI